MTAPYGGVRNPDTENPDNGGQAPVQYARRSDTHRQGCVPFLNAHYVPLTTSQPYDNANSGIVPLVPRGNRYKYLSPPCTEQLYCPNNGLWASAWGKPFRFPANPHPRHKGTDCKPRGACLSSIFFLKKINYFKIIA